MSQLEHINASDLRILEVSFFIRTVSDYKISQVTIILSPYHAEGQGKRNVTGKL